MWWMRHTSSTISLPTLPNWKRSENTDGRPGHQEKFGKNAIMKGMNLEDAATTRERNLQIGGHKSGESD